MAVAGSMRMMRRTEIALPSRAATSTLIAVLVARLTPGHTPGCTTWTMRVTDGGKTYHAVILGSPNFNPGYQLVNNARYPQIAADYAHGFEVLKSLPCDLFLGAHGDYFGMVAKHARLPGAKTNPFVDPDGYQAYVENRYQAFREKRGPER